MVKIDLSGVPSFGGEMMRQAELAYVRIASGEGELGKWNGWLELPGAVSPDMINRINETAEKIIGESCHAVWLILRFVFLLCSKD